ncbi:uncharacterized protein LOC132904434 [Amyelois transitella]|uniref:uncharacterized protein LOC132904434 n=1 Tax=Amyelois transitella TaxID=680683 RepID=UPI00298FE78D|nr:uncharacterized protein LOC132904434 [Amyelois transitella]
MPPKKNKLKQRNKQLKIIQSKLMEISLKIDNYIYKSKPISLKDAQTYYEEVCSYKHQCEGNARMLQVIDKLKHQLRALIEEHCDDSYNVQEIIENSITTCPMSPTYSLHDADRTDVHNYEVTAVIVDDDMNYKQKEDNIDKGEQIESIDLYGEKDLDETIIIDKEKQDESSIIKKLEKSLSQLTVKINNPELLQTKHHETKTANKEIISHCERSNHSKDTSQNSADTVSHCDTKISNNTFETSNKNLMHSNNKVPWTISITKMLKMTCHGLKIFDILGKLRLMR